MTAAAATPKPRTRRTTKSKTAASAQAPADQQDLPLGDEQATPAAPEATVEAASAPAERPSLASTIDLTTVTLDSFKYHEVAGGSLVFRKAVFNAIALKSSEELMALPDEVRRRLFGLIRWETGRYYGTAVRRSDSQFGKKGDPLPKLKFPSGSDAVAYREAMRRASNKLRRAVFGPDAVPA